MRFFWFCPPERCFRKSCTLNQEILLPHHIWSAGRWTLFIKFYYSDLQCAYFLDAVKSWFWNQILFFLGSYNTSVSAALAIFSYQHQSDEQNRADTTDWWLFSCTAAFSCWVSLAVLAARPRWYVSEWNMNRFLEAPSIRERKGKPTAFHFLTQKLVSWNYYSVWNSQLKMIHP